MAEYFKNKIIGKLSDKPIIVKKITPQPKTQTIIPIVEESFIEPEILLEEKSPKEEIETPIEPEFFIEEPITVPNDTVTDSNEIVIFPLEEPTPKKSRKKKSV